MDYGLIGKSLPHSYSKIIHNKIDSYDYILAPMEEAFLDEFMKKADFKGINVTIPYKKAVIPYLAEISETARRIGSVNTVLKREDGTLFGDNTDYPGFVYMVQRAGISFENAKVVILGSGGTSLTAQAVAKDLGAASVVVVSRGGDDNYNNISRHFDADVLVNTTPLGMYPKNGESAVDISGFTNLKGVIDVIYNPLYTKLLLDAKQRGIPHTGGLSMLVAQGVYAYCVFFGKEYDPCITERVLSEMERETENIVLIGMPGSGKSTIGKLLSERLNREFVDTDEYIEKQQNASILEIFERYGEAGFRMMESDTAGIVGKLKGQVISGGGGIILKEENYRSLKQNGKIIFIERSLDELSTDGRPLSKSREALEAIYKSRIDLYRRYADITVVNNKTPDEVAGEILQACYKG